MIPRSQRKRQTNSQTRPLDDANQRRINRHLTASIEALTANQREFEILARGLKGLARATAKIAEIGDTNDRAAAHLSFVGILVNALAAEPNP